MVKTAAVMAGIRRIPKIKPSFSGPAGELRVACEFLKRGYQIAKPLVEREREEPDLVLMCPKRGCNLFIPIQVKTFQNGTRMGRTVRGPTKKKIEEDPFLSLAIYHVQTDVIWFFCGMEGLKDAYDKTQGSKAFGNLDSEGEVSFNFQNGRNEKLDDWRTSNSKFDEQISSFCQRLEDFNNLKGEL